MPYPNMSNKETRSKVACGYRMPAPRGTPPAIYQLMLDCWAATPSARPNFTTVYSRLSNIVKELPDDAA